jgi:site-specific recombinase XerD
LKALKIFADINQQKKNGMIFTKNGVKLNVDYVSKQFKKAIRETKLNQNLHLHSLRHSFSSNLIAKGASLYHVSKLLSHSRISTTEKYSHVNMKELRETEKKYNRKYMISSCQRGNQSSHRIEQFQNKPATMDLRR